MPRYRITIEYDGTPFVGWQTQAVGKTVQSSLQTAIASFCGETVSIRGAGRTDSGVHALGQVAHFDLAREQDPYRIREALNHLLRPNPIAVLECVEVGPEFDARFSATARHYLYRILDRRAPPALDRNRVWWLPVGLDAEAMHNAAQCLVGHHDFTTFRASACQAASPVKTLDRLCVSRVGEEVHITASARSFLHNQVRSLVGTLKLVGAGRWTRADVAEALAARRRAACGPVAPPTGLYLVGVDYDKPEAMPGSVDH
ncbi:tRNA pseudouridine synthase A [Candidatus Filomicrobium marinum]|uniref:tRNA pseudouridine synthase A n=2 Tax=Filomicrobium TaxID=119044 RepID=A0A0D6JEU6_9HYPH|nr:MULTISPECIES: tRNA pseudouridine(38-40) synthase TruA [Filomicrobium]MCV0370259.1 tRNA pseudouridine(38-40) synthase TruA [Filomicrobium sp.]CFX23253.1 tRNA pseudouridine synthase A [Candidatus Filomicrobium marinum]CPR19016.1 tRNA pseudouridine synthase A [Candidatus Filomicrobium marinum]SDO11201.1 tRNA pseudouridine38-40 synthase [Filomicrobium insigne]